MNIVLVFFGPKNITFHNILTQKYRTYLPVCVCAECPLGLDGICELYSFLFYFAVLALGEYKKTVYVFSGLWNEKYEADIQN